jgi:hypothetical protein
MHWAHFQFDTVFYCDCLSLIGSDAEDVAAAEDLFD